jgi:hypothetical protein
MQIPFLLKIVRNPDVFLYCIPTRICCCTYVKAVQMNVANTIAFLVVSLLIQKN